LEEAVDPSGVKSLPTMTPSATERNFSTVCDFTPVFTYTFTPSPTASFASSTSEMSGSTPAIGPETRITSGRHDWRTDRATSPSGRSERRRAYSGVMLNHSSISSARNLLRSRPRDAASGCHNPMSDSYVPEITSRKNAAPVPTARPSAAAGSHRTSTPNGRSVGANLATTAAIVATISGPACSW
jgi:hypothetical protein